MMQVEALSEQSIGRMVVESGVIPKIVEVLDGDARLSS
jgi:hypothetical protein